MTNEEIHQFHMKYIKESIETIDQTPSMKQFILVIENENGFSSYSSSFSIGFMGYIQAMLNQRMLDHLRDNQRLEYEKVKSVECHG